jgi:hypothetical protein
LIHPTIGATRTEEDFKNHIARTLDTDPEAGWIFIVDQLNIHPIRTIAHNGLASAGWENARQQASSNFSGICASKGKFSLSPKRCDRVK